MISEKERIYLEYLVLHCQHREPEAWEELIDLYEKRLLYFVLQMVEQHQDALNVMQETWLKAFRSVHKIRQPASLTPWLYRIARNMALQFLRSNHKALSIDNSLDLESVVCDDTPEESYAAEQVHRGLKLLTPAHREALALYYLEDFSLQQIADILSVPIGTVRSRLHYAKHSLKVIIEKEKENGSI